MLSISVKPHLLTTDEAEKFLGVTPGTLAVWGCVARYRLPFVKIGRNVRYDQEDLVVWMESRKVRGSEVTTT